MTGSSGSILQLKITLKNVKPPVWRRIQIPGDSTFFDLHVAIQDAMGWLDGHLHQFEVAGPVKGTRAFIGVPDEEFIAVEEKMPGWDVQVTAFLNPESPKAIYEYDFGDGWEHVIALEKTLDAEAGVTYPRCVSGRRNCPPEDCGGPWGYEDFLKAIQDPNHEMHQEMLEWIGGGFDPEAFDSRDVVFSDPRDRLDILLRNLGMEGPVLPFSVSFPRPPASRKSRASTWRSSTITPGSMAFRRPRWI